MKILALDLGKSKTVGCMLDTAEHTHGYATIQTVPSAVVKLVEREGPDRVVFEVCGAAGWVHDLIVAQGIEVQVANPSHEGWRWRNVKRKTDRLDALKLAELSSVDQLPQVHMPVKAVREHRSLIRYRQQLVSRRRRIKNGIRSLLVREGLSMPAGAAGWSKSSRERLASWACPLDEAGPEQLWRGELQEELEALGEIEARILRVEAKLDALASRDERIERLRTIPCVGPRTAEMLVAVIDDPHRFRRGKQVGSYVGLVPRQYQSGQMDRQGRISKQGHRRLRTLLTEVSWLALRYNEPLRAFYRRVCRGSRSRRKKAIVAVARKLLITAWALLRDGTVWSPRPGIARV